MKVAFAAVVLSGVTLAMSACQQQPRCEPPQKREDIASGAPRIASPKSSGSAMEAREPDGAMEATEPAPEDDEITGGTTIPVGSWGITITIPKGASSQHEAKAERHTIDLSADVSVTLHKVNLPAPTSLAEAAKGWNSDDDSKNLGEGVTPNGVFYGVRTFQVRVGVPNLPRGRHLHALKQVSRVYAVLALDQGSRVTCTGYVERGVVTARDPDIKAVRAICMSMRKAKAGE
jgi:hypothetical protein